MISHPDAGPAWDVVKAETVIDLFHDACRRAPERAAVIFEDGLVISYAALREKVEDAAARLSGKIASGEHVAIMIDNRAEFMIAFLAVVMLRGVLVPFAPGARDVDAGHMLHNSGSVLAVASEASLGLLESLKGSCPALREIVTIAGEEPDGLRAIGVEQGTAIDRGCQRSDITAIYYTSGTTGMPKGCMIDHEYWLRACDVLHRLSRPAEGFAQLSCVPFYHVDAVGQFVVSLQSAGTIVYMRRFSASRFWTVARAHDVSEIFLVASMPILLLKQEPGPCDREHRISTAVCAAMPPQLHREFCERFGILLLEGYGSTEAGWLARVPKAFGEAMIGSGSIGVAMPEVEYRIIDDTGRDVGEDKPGELMVKAPGLFRGYVNDPAATAAVLKDGWYSTGDIVSRDDRGFLYFRGRRKDFIRRAGENIACAEIEDVLRMIPLILDAAVVAIPDEIRGEEALAYVILMPGAIVATLPPEVIAAHCAQHLTFFKVPRYIAYWTGDFPRTPTMRVQKGALAGTRLAIWDRMTNVWTGEDRDSLSA